MKKLLMSLFSLLTIVTMYLPDGGKRVWENVQSFGFEDARSILMVKGYAMIPVLWIITEDGQKVYIHGDYTVELGKPKPLPVVQEKEEE